MPATGGGCLTGARVLLVPGTAGLVWLAVAAVRRVRQWRRQLAQDAAALTAAARSHAGANGRCIELNSFEQERTRFMPPITTANLYRGACDDAVVEELRRRVHAVVRANPWLAGRVAPARAGGRTEALHCPAAEDVDGAALVTVVEEPRLRLGGMGYTQLAALLAPHALDGGATGIGRGRLFQAVLVSGPLAEGGQAEACFALVISLSHVVADGCTFYRIYRMLAGTDPVAPLDATRREPAEPPAGARGREAWRQRGPQPKMIYELLSSRPHSPRVFGVDAAAVAARKAAHLPSPRAPFISTHDVLTAHLLSAMRVHAGWFAVDTRGRARGIRAELAGNYEELVLLLDDELADPGAVRSVLRTWRHPAHTRLPAWPWSMACSVGLVSSWVFGSVSMLPWGAGAAVEQVAHLPIFSAMAPVLPRMAVIFQLRPGSLAVLSFTDTVAPPAAPPASRYERSDGEEAGRGRCAARQAASARPTSGATAAADATSSLPALRSSASTASTSILFSLPDEMLLAQPPASSVTSLR